MIGSSEFPRLIANNHQVASPAAVEYNCIAWSLGDTEHWWEPGRFWPTKSSPPPNDYGLGVLDRLFRDHGYEECADDSPEAGFEKVALYGSGLYYSHAARQLPNGKWTSKLGKMEDIEHDSPDAVAGGVYGEVVQIMRRRTGTTVDFAR